MDLKVYYQKIREMEEKISGDSAVVVSRETANGGKEGTRTEVPRRAAAKLIVDGLARLATAAESEAFQQAMAEAKRRADQIAAASRVQFAVLSTAELDRFKGSSEERE